MSGSIMASAFGYSHTNAYNRIMSDIENNPGRLMITIKNNIEHIDWVLNEDSAIFKKLVEHNKLAEIKIAHELYYGKEGRWPICALAYATDIDRPKIAKWIYSNYKIGKQYVSKNVSLETLKLLVSKGYRPDPYIFASDEYTNEDVKTYLKEYF